MPSLNTLAGPASILTWGQAALRVARSVGRMGDPALVAAAKDAISEALQFWNTKKDWRFLQILAPDIPITANTTRYDLPTNWKKPYDAIIVESQTKLEYVEARLNDTWFPGGSNLIAPAGYSLYNVGTTGEIELLPVSTNGTLRVRYFRPIIESGADDAFLDLPSRYVPGILWEARSLMCIDAGRNTAADRWEAKANDFLTWAKRDDDHIPDEEIRFRSASEMQNMNTVLLDEID